MRDWGRHFFYRRVCLKTTWKLRIGAVALAILAVAATRDLWIVGVGRSLVCAQELAPSDVILIENFDPNYVVFERAAQLERAGFAPRTLVPVQAAHDPTVANPIFQGFAEVMAREARLSAWDIIPIQVVEPISLNAAMQIRKRLDQERIKSLIVVTGGFRSRRTSLIYHRVLGDAGIQIRCVPVFGQATPGRWTQTWHGVQEIAEEFGKLQYYRFYVLPFVAHRSPFRGA